MYPAFYILLVFYLHRMVRNFSFLFKLLKNYIFNRCETQYFIYGCAVLY